MRKLDYFNGFAELNKGYFSELLTPDFAFNLSQFEMQSFAEFIGPEMVIDGTSGNDNLVGTADDDEINGFEGNDTLQGLGGDDLLNGGIGNDSIDGGEGNDTVTYTDFFALPPTANAGGGDSSGGSVGGDADSAGAGGNAEAENGSVNMILGGFHLVVDLGTGKAFRDLGGVLSPTSTEIDTLISIENVIGTDLNDSLTGNDDDNIIFGQAGDDLIEGGDGDDILDGGNVDQAPFFEFTGTDTINGGAGDDTIIYSNTDTSSSEIDTIDGGDGIDTFVMSNITEFRSVDLLAGVYSFSFDVDIGGFTRGFLSNIENVEVIGAVNVRGDNGDNVITVSGPAGDNLLLGEGGNDMIFADAGSDEVRGGLGNDMIWGGEGDDVLFGGTGSEGEVSLAGLSLGSGFVTRAPGAMNNSIATAIDVSDEFSFDPDPDIFQSTDFAHVSISGVGEGDVHYYSITLTEDNQTMLFDIDYAAGGTGFFDSWLELYDSGGTLISGSDDSATDPGSTSTLDSGFTFTFATAGTYTIAVGSFPSLGNIPAGGDYELQISLLADPVDTDVGGDDILNGGAGADVLDGGLGIDTADYSDAAAGVRADLTGSFAQTGDAMGDTFISIENMNGSEFRDFLLGDGGENGLFGNGGNDALFGRGGDDFIVGGDGNDFLVGGAGEDTFSFGEGHGIDRITDFVQGEDLIDFTGGPEDFDDLTIEQVGDDVVITSSAGTIRVNDSDVGDFTEDDFIFADMMM